MRITHRTLLLVAWLCSIGLLRVHGQTSAHPAGSAEVMLVDVLIGASKILVIPPSGTTEEVIIPQKGLPVWDAHIAMDKAMRSSVPEALQ
ncbi:MAG: hypothetical protein IPN62_07935 [Flavobacteriales bacterium]|nr:hypothetical protein [Flavobacteriales bacterium]